MKLLHSSDWHLGRSLYGKKRYEEFEKFLSWLETTIKEEVIDTLLISGDVFDNSTPGNRAQELYYRFLNHVSSSACHHIVIIAGNHDSPSFINAPKDILQALSVYVVGSSSENPDDEVFILHDNDNKPEAIVCAVPYLRDRDIRTAEAGENIDEKNEKLLEGIKNHYKKVSDAAERNEEKIIEKGFKRVPLIALGHLFTAGGKTIDGDGVRDLYVGSLAHVDRDLFPSNINYLALGHLHVPQKVGGEDNIRYSGSPLPMGFGEALQEKKVIIVEFNESEQKITEKTVPVFQKLEKISGNLKSILERLDILRFEKSDAWLEIEYTGKEIEVNLREVLEEAVKDTSMELLRIKNRQFMQKLSIRAALEEELDNIDEKEVFIRCLDSFNVAEEEREDLITSYMQILDSINEEDINEQ